MPLPLYHVDAFTDRPFSGNPAAVCLLVEERPAEWMQSVAAELALSETAFVRRDGDGLALRWFTPVVEVDLCGHATLASAHVLWEVGWLDTTAPARFHTRSGLLTATRNGDWIELDFPAFLPEPVEAPDGLFEALGVRPLRTVAGGEDLLVELPTAEDVRALSPDIRALARIETRGVIVTSCSDCDESDFVSRFFAPAAGIDEDPVTGSAHCLLGPYWAERLGRTTLVGYQASARGGCVRVEVRGDRVTLAGRAVTVIRGSLLVD